MPDLTYAALAVTPSISAVELIDDFENIEIELTKLETNFLIKTGQVIVARSFGCPSCGRANLSKPVLASADLIFVEAGFGDSVPIV